MSRFGFAPAAVLLSAAVFSTACYRPSDQYLATKGDKPETGTPEAVAPGTGAADPAAGPGEPGGDPGADVAGTGQVADPGAPSTLTPSPSPPPPPEYGAGAGGPGPQPDAEAAARDMFGRHDMKALPELDKMVGSRPGELDELVRGAFAGVGNDTDKCQEILLYLTVRHMHQADALAAAAASANPEIQSFAQ